MATKAESLFARMTQIGLTPTYVTYNSLIDVYVRCGLMDRAWTLFGQMRQKGFKPDNFTCSTLVKGIRPTVGQMTNGYQKANSHNQQSSQREMQRGFELLYQMVQTREQFREWPDEVLYNCLIDMCVRFGDLDSAEQLFA